MIINNENKNQIMQGMMKRGFNQKPSDIVDRLNGTLNTQKNIKTTEQINKGNQITGTYNTNVDYHGIISKMNDFNRRSN